MSILPPTLDIPTAFRMVGNLFTVGVCYLWLRFADVRDGCLDAPSIHHRVYLRLLIAASIASLVLAVASVAVTVRQ